MTVKPVLVLFRRDFRLADNPALWTAAQLNRPILPVYIDDENPERPWGNASRWWLHQSLRALDESLQARGLKLIIRKGPTAEILRGLIQNTQADRIHWNRIYQARELLIDREILSLAQETGCSCHSFNANLLHDPKELKTGTGGPYRVFTPFFKALTATFDDRAPLPPPEHLIPLQQWPDTDPLLCSARLDGYWSPGEQGAQDRFFGFLEDDLKSYAELRDIPSKDATSRLSPHLAFGEISPRQIWHHVRQNLRARPVHMTSGDAFLRQLSWREFSAHLLFHFPEMTQKPWNEKFKIFPWHSNETDFYRWSSGETGYPIIDAGMRQLRLTGTMHNRVRMLTASFLTKHLLIDWRQGENWFWQQLVDADPANNPVSWQWVAGSGADAAPYFRIFNPTLQGEKFDPKGRYIQTWVPELGKLPQKYIHRPHEAPAEVLETAHIKLGTTYPFPMVDHRAARTRALIAYDHIRTRS